MVRWAKKGEEREVLILRGIDLATCEKLQGSYNPVTGECVIFSSGSEEGRLMLEKVKVSFPHAEMVTKKQE